MGWQNGWTFYPADSKAPPVSEAARLTRFHEHPGASSRLLPCPRSVGILHHPAKWSVIPPLPVRNFLSTSILHTKADGSFM
jgi:hypothetical protein